MKTLSFGQSLTFAHREIGDQPILPWLQRLIVELPAAEMGRRVDQPRLVQRDDVAEEVAENHSHHRLAPKVHRHRDGKDAPNEQDKGNVEATLEAHQRVRPHVRHVNLGAFLLHQRVLPTEQPADVGKEEAPFGVVRIGVRLRVLVVGAVVANPFVDVILDSSKDEKDGQISHVYNSCLWLKQQQQQNWAVIEMSR